MSCIPPLLDLVFAAPGMLLVGMASGYVLVRQRDAGAPPGRLRWRGLLGGLVLGVLAPPAAWATALLVPDFLAGTLGSGIDADYLIWLLPRMGPLGGLAGALTGAGLGAILGRRAVPGATGP